MNIGVIIFIVVFAILCILQYNKLNYSKYSTELFAPFTSDYIDPIYPEMVWNNQTRFTKYMSYDLRGGIPPLYYYTGPWNQPNIFY
jgi:hypothetical protein